MSKETEVLEEYMSQQQRKINDLTQAVLLLQTRNILLEKELLNSRGYILAENDTKVLRPSVVNLTNVSNTRVVEIKKIENFTTLEPSIPVARKGFGGSEGKEVFLDRIKAPVSVMRQGFSGSEGKIVNKEPIILKPKTDKL